MTGNVMDEETYLSIKGASRQDIGDSAFHKNKGNNSDKTWSKMIDAQSEKDRRLIAKRDVLRKEYRQKIKNGELREPTRNEKLIATANGNIDNECTMAARRLLIKKGIDWRKQMIDKESKNDLRDALIYSADKLTEEHFDFCVHECPSIALTICADKLTSEQLDYCVHMCPATALLLCAHMLSKEQKKYCEERTKRQMKNQRTTYVTLLYTVRICYLPSISTSAFMSALRLLLQSVRTN